MAQGRWKKTSELISAAHAALKVEQPMTLRQLFYRLVSAAIVNNARSDYQKLSRITSRARERGEIPFEWIVDRSRPEIEPYVFDDPQQYLRSVAHGYARDYWQDQPAYVEIWTEKDSLTGSIEEVTLDLGVPVRVGRGFVSVSRAHEIAERFQEISKPITVFYLGDHDPSGRNIETEIRDRVRSYGSGPFHMRRLAIHARDIAKFHLPPLRVKAADSRAASFRAKYGNECVEVDALPPTELRKRITDAVEALMDMDKWNRALAVEQAEQKSIAEAVANWPKQPDSELD
jgi:hypothetical protein